MNSPVIREHYNSNQLMNPMRDSQLQPGSHLMQQDRHLQFATQQAVIKRVHSLRKVETLSPSFVPQINELPFEIYPQRTKTEISKQQIVERLIENRREKAESLRAQKARKEDEIAGQCTFQPQINAESKRIVGYERLEGKSEPFQRLYEEGLSRMRSMGECMNVSDEDKQNCTFQPNIGSKSRQQSYTLPIYQRLEQIIADKREKMRRLQEEKEEEIKQKPEVNFKSKEIVENKADFKKNVLERLFGHLKEKNNRLEQMVERKEEEIAKQCTFHPAVNYQAESYLEEQDFLQRQEREALKAREKATYLKQQLQAPFKPQINKLSSMLVEAERENQTQSEKIERMCGDPVLERKAQIERMEESMYRECTFQPEINALSKALQGQPHSHKCSCAPKQEHYHFHPQINPKSRVLAGKGRAKQTGQTAEQARLQLQYKEMKQCTFKPKTLGEGYRSIIQKTSLKEVAGADSYQQRIDRAKAKRKEEEMLKQKLFQMQKGYVGRDHTKFEPFKLTQKQPKIAKLKQAAQEQFKKHHPFRPILATMR